MEKKISLLINDSESQSHKNKKYESEFEKSEDMEIIDLGKSRNKIDAILEKDSFFNMEPLVIRDFIINERRVTFQGKNGHWKQVLSKGIIERSVPYEFQIRIIKTRY